jgi:putative transposase
VWYRYSDRALRDEAHLRRALNYLHYNPVKHGYADDPYGWPWSSLHGYLEAEGREKLREWWKLYPPGDFGRGWDDR